MVSASSTSTPTFSVPPMTAEAAEAHFLYVEVANKPRRGGGTVRDVRVTLTFSDEAGNEKLSIPGRWSATPQHVDPELTLAAQPADVATGCPCLVDLAMKYQGDRDLYAFNDENRFSGNGLRHNKLGTDPLIVTVRAHSPGGASAVGRFIIDPRPIGKPPTIRPLDSSPSCTGRAHRHRLRRLKESDQLGQRPRVIRQTGGNGRCRAEACVNAAVVVVGEVQAHGGSEVLDRCHGRLGPTHETAWLSEN